MTEPTPIVQTILPGGTSRGWSYWNEWLGCERKAWYKEKAPPRIGGLSGNYGTDVGTVMHKLQELYYTMDDGDLLNTKAIQWVDPIGFPDSYVKKVVKEGNRVFNNYRMHHAPDELGEVVEAEREITVSDFMGLGIEFSIAPDLVTYVGLEEGRALGIEPNIYIWDHKTYGSGGPDDELATKHDLRFPAYIMAYEQATGVLPGLILNITYRTKVPTFKRIPVAYPDELTRRRVISTLARAKGIRDSYVDSPRALDTPCRTNQCRSRFGKFCNFMDKCTRY